MHRDRQAAWYTGIGGMLLGGALLIGAPAIHVSTAHADDAPAAEAPAAEAPDGKAIWSKKCKSCHGSDGLATKTGKKKKSPDNLADKTSKMTHEEIVKVITEGDKKMPAFKEKLSAEEIEAVAKYSKTVGTPTPPGAEAPAGE